MRSFFFGRKTIWTEVFNVTNRFSATLRLLALPPALDFKVRLFKRVNRCVVFFVAAFECFCVRVLLDTFLARKFVKKNKIYYLAADVSKKIKKYNFCYDFCALIIVSGKIKNSSRSGKPTRFQASRGVVACLARIKECICFRAPTVCITRWSLLEGEESLAREKTCAVPPNNKEHLFS